LLASKLAMQYELPYFSPTGPPPSMPVYCPTVCTYGQSDFTRFSVFQVEPPHTPHHRNMLNIMFIVRTGLCLICAVQCQPHEGDISIIIVGWRDRGGSVMGGGGSIGNAQRDRCDCALLQPPLKFQQGCTAAIFPEAVNRGAVVCKLNFQMKYYRI